MLRNYSGNLTVTNKNCLSDRIQCLRDKKVCPTLSEVWWKFREALDPDQPDGSAIALPPDPELRADICAPTWKLSARGILLESKDGSSGFGNLRQRLGRSPGKADAVVMAWSDGNQAAVSRHNAWKWEKPRQRWIV